MNVRFTYIGTHIFIVLSQTRDKRIVVYLIQQTKSVIFNTFRRFFTNLLQRTHYKPYNETLVLIHSCESK